MSIGRTAFTVFCRLSVIHPRNPVGVRIFSRNMVTPSKLAKRQPYIGTHDQTFHCDDVTACFMLKQLDRFKDHDIVRTRDEELLANAEIVVDVGSVLDVDRLRLDHHQRSFNQTIHDYHPKLRTTNLTKPPRLSSSGLVFAIFGKDVIMKQLGMDGSYKQLTSDEEKDKIDSIYERAYTEYFEEIDAIDNGIEVATGENLVWNYHVNSGISSRVGRLNPLDRNASDEERLIQFKKAMEVVGAEITEGIRYLGEQWWPEQQKFKKFVLDRKQFHPSGQLVLIEFCPGWKSSLYRLEEESGCEGELKYVIYNSGGSESPWRATGVPKTLKSFECRVFLKEEWRGKRDIELQQVSGIPDASFVHMSGFTGGAKSLEGIKKMCLVTLGLDK